MTSLVLLALFLFQSPAAVEITAEPSHHLILENSQVRVFEFNLAPKASSLLHRHDHDYVVIPLGAAQFSNETEGKPPVTVKLADGEVRFSPGPLVHLVRDLSPTPFRNITVELMQDQKLRKSSGKWDEDRGVQILNAGTIDILFVKDGVRISDVQLQPGGMIPGRTYKGPELLVAVNDFELHSSGPGGPMSQVELKTGEVKWLPPGARMLMNSGNSAARLITLEFPAR